MSECIRQLLHKDRQGKSIALHNVSDDSLQIRFVDVKSAGLLAGTNLGGEITLKPYRIVWLK